MDYEAIYGRIIDRARGRFLSCYAESHHIVPRCMGGTDERANLVRLTPEEHFLAHQLLVKMHPGNPRLIFAVKAMAMNPLGKRANNKMFGWLRREYSRAISERQKGRKVPEHVAARLRTAALGRKASDEERARRKIANKLAASRRPPSINPFLGKKHSPESLEKMSEAHATRWTDEARAKYRAKALEQRAQGKFTRRGAALSEETKAKLRAAAIARHSGSEAIEKQRAALEALAREGSNRKAAKALGIALNTFKNRLRAAQAAMAEG